MPGRRIGHVTRARATACVAAHVEFLRGANAPGGP